LRFSFKVLNAALREVDMARMRALRIPLIAITLFACSVFGNPLGLYATSSYGIISPSGQSLSSVFEGLKPSTFLRPTQLQQYRPVKRKWKGITSNRLPGVLLVDIIGGRSCPGTEVCSGNFTVIEGSGGCLDCVGHNFSIDFVNGPCFAGEQNAYCGEFCCVDAQDCFNRFGCGR
jgi:hypothetical protein